MIYLDRSLLVRREMSEETLPLDRESRLKLFDEATQRQRERENRRGIPPPTQDRGWKREDLYDRDSRTNSDRLS